MYQSFHSSNYRGNAQGHDNQLRSDSQQPSTYNFGGFVQAQYQGQPRQYQPTGQVQSFYGQQTNQSFQQPSQSQYGTQFQNHSQFQASNQFQNSTSFQQGSQLQNQNQQFQAPTAFHTSNYRGNQTGHDTYLRSDSANASYRPTSYTAGQSGALTNQSLGGYQSATWQSGTGGITNQSLGSQTAAFQPSQQSAFQNQANQSQYANPQSFHTAQYHGSQPGHDQYWRGDSKNPSQTSGWSSNFGQ